MAERIDAHHHLWHYVAEEYPWIDGRMTALQRDFLPPDFEKETAAAGIDGALAVQARQSLEETRWLLRLANKSSLIRGVIGWAPLANPNFAQILEELTLDDGLKGLRHVIHDEADDEFILREDFNRGIRSLRGTGLVYDILVFERHLPQTIEFVDRHPKQIFVLDHIGKPRIAQGAMEPWRRNIFTLAKRDHVYCKISGMVTEANWKEWKEEDLKPYWEVVLEAFEPERLIAGSDWPVCLLASSYTRWFEMLQNWMSDFSQLEKEKILGGTALEVYRLETLAYGKE
jgi:L-fucono-1,5-lactonase